MIEGPISQDGEYIETETGTVYTVLSGNDDGMGTATTTVLEVLGTEVPCIAYYSTSASDKVIVCSEADFRNRFEAA